MADDQQPSPIRKTITLTHKQAGLTGIVGAVLLALQPMLSHFSSKDETDAHFKTVQVQLSAEMDQLNEIKQAIHDVNETMQKREEQSEARQRATDERQDRQIESLEASRNLNRKTNTN